MRGWWRKFGLKIGAPLSSAIGVKKFLTRLRRSRVYTAGASASCARPTEPRREGRADRGADRKAGVGGRAHRRAGRTHRGPGGAAQPPNPVAEDPRQFIEAALARTQARPPGTWCRPPAAPKPPRCRSDAASEPGSHDRPAAEPLAEMQSGVSGRVANPAAGL